MATHRLASELSRRSLTRLIDPDGILRRKIVEFVEKGEFGLASGITDDGGFNRLWFAERIETAEVAFEANVFLVTKAKSRELKDTFEDSPEGPLEPVTEPGGDIDPEPDPELDPDDPKTTLRIAGAVPSEAWNRLGTKILPKLRSGEDLRVGIECTVRVHSQLARTMKTELQQILNDLDLAGKVRIERTQDEEP